MRVLQTVVAFLSVLILSSIGQAQECPSSAMDEVSRKTFLLFGDSLTQRSFDEGGWGARLASAYQRKADVIARGYSGYNTRWAAYPFEKVFTKGHTPPDLVTIFFGANDAALPDRLGGRQHVPIEEFVGHLKAFVKHICSLGTKHVVLITPPPVDEAARVQENQQKVGGEQEAAKLPERTNAAAGEYAKAVKQLGEELAIPVVDLWSNLQMQPLWPAYLSDGLHFNSAGNALVYALVQAKINEALPHLRPDMLAMDFPGHADIDASSPASAFKGTASS